MSACASRPSEVLQPPSSSLCSGDPSALQEEEGMGRGGRAVFLTGWGMGMSPVLVPPCVLPGAAWDPAH